MDRGAALSSLDRDTFDVLIVGGGITGAGIALICALAGKRTALIEKEDFGWATSSRSSKLIHGGIRYMAQFDFPMVMEGVKERGRLLNLFPALVQPLGFLLPLVQGLRRPLGLPACIPSWLRGVSLRFGLGFYEALNSSGHVPKHSVLNADEAFSLAPCLKQGPFKEAFLYYDAQADDVALTLATLRKAHEFGAVLANHLRARRLIYRSGKVIGLEAFDQLSQNGLEIKAKQTVNATGVYAMELAALDPGSNIHLMPSKGVHLVLSPEKFSLSNTALVLPETLDGRIAFLIPWMGKVLLGTTDSAYEGPLDEPMANPEDIRSLLQEAERYLDIKIERSDILGHFAGLRPLVFKGAKKGGETPSAISRKHKVIKSPSGLVHVAGGKLTTFLRMGFDAFKVLFPNQKPPELKTPLEPIPTFDASEALGPKNLSPEALEVLVRLYGSETKKIFQILKETPGLTDPLMDGTRPILAEALYHIRHTMALDLKGILETRLRLAWVLPDHGATMIQPILTLLHKELNVPKAVLQAQAKAYKAYIEAMDDVLKSV